MSLDAFFIGIIQVLVYAGAVMVLFLFIIMLLDLRAEERRKINWLASAGGIGSAPCILLVQICVVIGHFQAARRSLSAAGKIDDRTTCIEHRPAAFHQLQSAVPDHRRAHPGRDHRRGRPEPTRNLVNMITLGDYLIVSGDSFHHRLRRRDAAPQHHHHFHVARADAERGQSLARRFSRFRVGATGCRITTRRSSSFSSSPSRRPRSRSVLPSSSRSIARGRRRTSKTSPA